MTKVLHVISGDLWAGAESQAYTLLKHLAQRCSVHAVLLNDGELAKRLRSCHIPVTILDESRLSSWQILLKLRAILQNEKPDVIHTHRQKENILGAIANRSTIKALCVRTVHGASEFKGNWKTRLQRRLDQWIGNHLQDRIIAVSDELKTKLQLHYNEEKLRIIANGVDVEELNQIAALPASFKEIEPDKKHIGIIGRLVPVKRIDLFLETAAIFKKDMNDDYRFHVIGDGPLMDRLKSDSKRLHINGLVTFHGHRNDIASCIRSLDAVVMSSDHEGMPMVALETLALETRLLLRDTLENLIRQFNTESFSSPETLAQQLKEDEIHRVINIVTAAEQADCYLTEYARQH